MRLLALDVFWHIPEEGECPGDFTSRRVMAVNGLEPTDSLEFGEGEPDKDTIETAEEVGKPGER